MLDHDEGARQRLESLENFVADNFGGVLYYCATHQIHYTPATGVATGINVSSIMASMECPVAQFLYIRNNEDKADCRVSGSESVDKHARRFV